MPHTTCPECDRPVDSDAVRCVCGHPLRPIPEATVPGRSSGDVGDGHGAESNGAGAHQLGLGTGAASPGDLLFGRFRVVEEIGRGGMGVVYKSKDEQLDDEVVAVKVLAGRLVADANAVARLKQEVITAQRLQHAGIVRINQFYSGDGLAGFDMEFLEGATLAQHLDDEVVDSPFARPVDAARLPAVADLVEQLASALDYVHEMSLVHRDIKPSNVMLVPRAGGEFHVKLLDFGIVQVGGGQGMTGQLQPGTLEFMAPELFNPNGKPSRGSDIFALGKVVYMALTGVSPEAGYDSDPPSAKVEDLPPSVDAPVLDCMGRLERRPKSAGRLAAVIRDAADELLRPEEAEREASEAADPEGEEESEWESREEANHEATAEAEPEMIGEAQPTAEELADREVYAEVGQSKRDDEELEEQGAARIEGIRGFRRFWPVAAGVLLSAVLIACVVNWRTYRIVEMDGQATVVRGYFSPWGYYQYVPIGGEAAFEPIPWVQPPPDWALRGGLQAVSDSYYALTYLCAGRVRDDNQLFLIRDTQASAFESWYRDRFDDLPDAVDKMSDLRHKVKDSTRASALYYLQRDEILADVSYIYLSYCPSDPANGVSEIGISASRPPDMGVHFPSNGGGFGRSPGRLKITKH